jgi:hypothetical protein
MSAVFISYRRADSQFTGRICARLREALGAEQVFQDTTSILPGAHFPEVLEKQLNLCRVAVIVIGPEWARVQEADGTRRLDNPNDFVRFEVEKVLARGIPVIPVLIGGAGNLVARDLPITLHDLTLRHTTSVRDGDQFDEDMAKLASHLKHLLDAAPVPTRDDRTPIPRPTVDQPRDRAWPEIARHVARGNWWVVLTGPAGIGKATTAGAFARWCTRGTEPIVIDLAEEFTDLTFIEAVGQQYPEKLYQDRKGVPFLTEQFETQRRFAIDVLAEEHAPVVLLNAGKAEYPRDPNTETELAVKLAKELAEKSVLVVVVPQQIAGWEDCNPITLHGLSAEHARQLIQRELDNAAEHCSMEELTAHVGGPAALEELISRGNPGELKQVVDRATAKAGPQSVTKPNPLARFGGGMRRVVEALLGDPVMPKPGGTKVTPGMLFVTCIALLLVIMLALIWSYESGSQMWERMFYSVALSESDVPPLPAEVTKLSPGTGQLIEFARAVLVILVFFLVVIGLSFSREMNALLPHSPWADLGPRTFGLRSAFRLVFVTLAIWLSVSTVLHHLHAGPRTLWMCNGNPFLQKYLNGNDLAKIRELQNRPADDPQKMNGEPPAPGAAGYDEYYRQCVVPYWRYFPYSFVMFVLVGPTVLTVCFYSVCSSLWTHLVLQPKQVKELSSHTSLEELENRIRHYKETYAENVGKYLQMVLILLSCWAYHLWLDRYNLTASADDHTTRMILVALVAWAGLFAALMIAYQVLVRQAGRRFPDGAPQDSFDRRHGVIRFFWRTVSRSGAALLCLIPITVTGAWYVLAANPSWLH